MTKNTDETYKNVQGNLIVTLFTKEKPEAIHKFNIKDLCTQSWFPH